MKINAASAVVPVATHEVALEEISSGLADPVLGTIGMEKVQLCPQHAGRIGEALVARLMEQYPTTEFRLHASPKLSGMTSRIVHLSNAREHPEYVQEALRLNRIMRAGGYSLHAGRRCEGSMESMLDALEEIEQKAGFPVAVEGLYPERGDIWLMSNWEEHEMVARRGLRYALDLSHLNIVSRVHGRRDDLVREMLSSKNCIEIHVSDNDGRSDAHQPIIGQGTPWWLEMLEAAGDHADIFYEGILVDPRRSRRPPQ